MNDTELAVAVAVIGVQGDINVQTVRSAYRARAALLHPDIHQAGGDARLETAVAAMQQLNDAYRALCDHLAAISEPVPVTVEPPPPPAGTQTTRCRACAARVEFPDGITMRRCPSCGRNVRADNQTGTADGTGDSPRPDNTTPLAKYGHVRVRAVDGRVHRFAVRQALIRAGLDGAADEYMAATQRIAVNPAAVYATTAEWVTIVETQAA